jgi:N-methylhydantoinase A
MAAAARAHATDRGVDYRGMPLFAFGGAGPVHACEVASLMQSSSVIVPPQPSVLSAFGTLVTSLRLDLVRSDLVRIRNLDWQRVDRILGELVSEASAALTAAGCDAGSITLIFGADLRYFGQQSELSIVLEPDPRIHREAARIERTFEDSYRKLYGVNPSHVPIELVTWRVTARGPVAAFNRATSLPSVPGRVKTSRAVHAWSEDAATPVYDRKTLAVGQTVAGPAIIEERETTTAIPPGWRATIDQVGCIIAEKG